MEAAPWAGLAVLLAGGLSAAYAARLQQAVFGPRDETDLPARRRESPHRVELAALAGFVLATLALSLLWIPTLHERALQRLHTAFTRPSGWETAASLLAVAFGLYAGFTLARRVPTLGEDGAPAAASDWLGLPRLIEYGITRPVLRLALLLARADNGIDAIPESIARAARGASQASKFLDQAAVDRAVLAIAAASTGLARLGDRFGEVLADGLASGPARLAAAGGRDLRPLQSGLSHQYFAGMAAAAVLLLAILFLAG